MIFIKQGKTNIKYLLIVVVLAAIVGGGVWYCQYTSVECNSPTDCEGKTHIMCVGEWECVDNQCAWNCQVEEKQEPEKAELEDEIADWKTYRNDEYGFEIKYPTDWMVDEKTYNTMKKLYVVSFSNQEKLKDGRMEINIQTTKASSALGWAQEAYGGPLEEVGLEGEITGQQYEEEEGIFTAFLKDNFLYQFILKQELKESETEIIYTQMLSTFRFIDVTACASMEISGYNYVFSDLNGEVKIDLDNDGQEEIIRIYKEDSNLGGRSKPIIVKIFSGSEKCPKEVFNYEAQSIGYYIANEFLENQQAFENFWGDGANTVSLEAIGTAYGSGSSMRLLLFTYRNGEYSVIEGLQVSGHNWQCCKFDGDNGIGNKIIAAESRWAEDYSDYCAGCDSKFQFFIYNWNGEEYVKTEAGITENKYSGNIEEILKEEPSVINSQ